MTTMTQHVDRFGIQLKEGDKVTFLYHTRTSSGLRIGVVTGATDCFVKVRPLGRMDVLTNTFKVSPEKTVRAPEHLQDYQKHPQ